MSARSRLSALLVAISATLLAAAAALSPSTAVAAFPGSNGRIAYTGEPLGGNVDIFTILPDGSGSQQLTDDSAYELDPSWSADGRRLVFTGLTEASNRQVFTINADGGDLTPIVNPHDEDPGPSFSPNGRRIVHTTGGSIRTIRTDGTDPRRVRRGRGFGGHLEEPQYSPSGKRIVFAGQPRGGKREGIWSMRRNGSRLRRLTRGLSDTEPDYSPDGHHIVFTHSGDCCNQIRVMRADGSRERPIPDTDQAAFPAYAPTGDRIVVMIARGPFSSCSDLITMSPTRSDRQRVTYNCGPGDFGGSAAFPSWQPLPGE